MSCTRVATAVSIFETEEMQSAIDGWVPSHVARFVIGETILPFMTIGKFFPPEHRLNWSGIPEENWDRTFRMTELNPMMANVLIFLYDCGGCNRTERASAPGKPNDHRVLTLRNERVVKTPFNATHYLASFEDFKLNFQPCSEEQMNKNCGNTS